MFKSFNWVIPTENTYKVFMEKNHRSSLSIKTIISSMAMTFLLFGSLYSSQVYAAPALPTACGGFSSEGFLLAPSPVVERLVRFNSNNPANDPYVTFPFFTRDTVTGIVSYTSPTGTLLAGTDFTGAGGTIVSELTTASQNSGLNSELWFITYRVDGIPGTAESLTLQTGVEHDLTSYWVTDTGGNVLGNDDWVFSTAPPPPNGDGDDVTIAFNYPPDGIAYINVAMYDPSILHGDYTISGYSGCPATPVPSLTTWALILLSLLLVMVGINRNSYRLS